MRPDPLGPQGDPYLPGSADFTVHRMGETAILVRLRLPGEVNSFKQLDDASRYACLLLVRALEERLELNAREKAEGWPREYVASYDTLLVPFEPEKVEPEAVRRWVEEQIALQIEEWRRAGPPKPKEGRLHRIGVIYGGERGFDLERIAGANGISPDELVHQHTSHTYTVYIIGFAPGFAYLGNLPGINAPRLLQPRAKVPGGSVAIAAGLTAVYPFDLPGGWNVIGYTPFSMFDINQNPPVRFQPGDRVQFYSITSEEAVADNPFLTRFR